MNAALRSIVWLGAVLWLAYLKKPDGAGILAVRTDAIGWIGGGLLVAGIGLHIWSNATLARAERDARSGSTRLVTEGPFQYVRHPIYLAGIPLLAGIYLLYANWNWADLVAAVIAVALVHIQVVRREEPKLRGRFGASYEEYCRRVPRWMPRF